MAVTLRGTPNGTNSASGTTNVVTKPTGVVSGDILILAVGWGPTGPTVTPPSGFALLQSTAFSDNSWTQAVYWKIAGGSEPSTYTTTFSGTTFSDTVMIAYQGEDSAATPLSSANTGTSTTPSGTSLTFTVNGSILLHVAVGSGAARTSGPSGMTNEITFDGNMYLDDVAVNSGASGNKTSVYPSQIWVVHMVGIQPAAAAANPPPPASASQVMASWVQAAAPTVTKLGIAAILATSPVVNAPLPYRPAIPDQWSSPAAQVQVRPGVAALIPAAPTPPIPWRSSAPPDWTLPPPAQQVRQGVAIFAGSAVVNAPPISSRAPRFDAWDPAWIPPARAPDIAAVIAPTGSQPRYIPSTNGRYHIDRLTGQPFPLLIDSAWVLPNNLNLTDTAQYLDDRVKKGYTAIIVQLMALGSAAGTTSGPADSGGHLPFTLNNSGGSYTGTTGTADFSTPNDTYWAYVRSVIDMITARGLLPICYVDFWGFGGDGVQGCATDITNSANTAGVCTAFGTYLATGRGTFSGFQSVSEAWFADGGDYGANNGTPPSSTLKTRTLAITSGMRAAGCTHLRYFDGQSPSMGTDETSFTSECQTQAVYTYGGTFSNDGPTSPALHTYQQSRLGWNYSPTSVSQGPYGATAAPSALPAWLKETVYAWDTSVEGRTVTRGEVRKAEYWAWLSGCTAGRAHGSSKIWDFISGGVWQAALSDAYELDAGLLNGLFKSIRWWDLVPSEQSGLRRLIPSANGTQTGTPDGYVAAAQSTDGTQLIAFVPSLSTGTQTFTVDMRSMAGTSRARWWDPTSGVFTDAGTFANSLSAQSFTTPGTNVGGDNDWLLIFDIPPAPWPTPPRPVFSDPPPPPPPRPGIAAIIATPPVVSAPLPIARAGAPDWTLPPTQATSRPGIAAVLASAPTALPPPVAPRQLPSWVYAPGSVPSRSIGAALLPQSDQPPVSARTLPTPWIMDVLPPPRVPGIAAIAATAAGDVLPARSLRQLPTWSDTASAPLARPGMAGILATSGLDAPPIASRPDPAWPADAPLPRANVGMAGILATGALDAPPPARHGQTASWADAVQPTQGRALIAALFPAAVPTAPPLRPPVGTVPAFDGWAIPAVGPKIGAFFSGPLPSILPPPPRVQAYPWPPDPPMPAVRPGIAAFVAAPPAPDNPPLARAQFTIWPADLAPTTPPAKIAAVLPTVAVALPPPTRLPVPCWPDPAPLPPPRPGIAVLPPAPDQPPPLARALPPQTWDQPVFQSVRLGIAVLPPAPDQPPIVTRAQPAPQWWDGPPIGQARPGIAAVLALTAPGAPPAPSRSPASPIWPAWTIAPARPIAGLLTPPPAPPDNPPVVGCRMSIATAAWWEAEPKTAPPIHRGMAAIVVPPAGAPPRRMGGGPLRAKHKKR